MNNSVYKFSIRIGRDQVPKAFLQMWAITSPVPCPGALDKELPHKFYTWNLSSGDQERVEFDFLDPLLFRPDGGKGADIWPGQIQSKLHVRPPLQNTKIFPVKALQLESLVNDHLL